MFSFGFFLSFFLLLPLLPTFFSASVSHFYSPELSLGVVWRQPILSPAGANFELRLADARRAEWRVSQLSSTPSFSALLDTIQLEQVCVEIFPRNVEQLCCC